MKIALALILVHDFYSYACCASHDCRPVPCEEIKEVARGWLWGPVFFGYPMMQPAPDGRCHVCVSEDLKALHMMKPQCIYLPPKTT